MANQKMKEYDMNKDGNISEQDVAVQKEILVIENQDKRELQQRRMAWVAMLCMLVFTMTLFTPLISIERINALSDLLGMFYIAQAGIIATFFGSQAFMTVNKS